MDIALIKNGYQSIKNEHFIQSIFLIHFVFQYSQSSVHPLIMAFNFESMNKYYFASITGVSGADQGKKYHPMLGIKFFPHTATYFLSHEIARFNKSCI